MSILKVLHYGLHQQSWHRWIRYTQASYYFNWRVLSVRLYLYINYRCCLSGYTYIQIIVIGGNHQCKCKCAPKRTVVTVLCYNFPKMCSQTHPSHCCMVQFSPIVQKMPPIVNKFPLFGTKFPYPLLFNFPTILQKFPPKEEFPPK